MKFYNTYTKRKEEFQPLDPGKGVRMYNCGPTIYDYAHIGNFRAYIFADLVRRYLEYKGHKVTQVMNITDVDDKTIRDSQAEGIPLAEYTRRFKEAFFQDIDVLRIKKASVYPEATRHIPEMLNLISRLQAQGFTYESEGSIYFRISTFPSYGKLAGIKIDELQAGARVELDEYEKEEARDFVLWKGRRPEDGDVYWDSDFGQGRPGWHIECSAMSMKYLGEQFDIHTGGEDNIFPHHENEIAQAEAATGKQFVKLWMHCGYLLVDGKKMSKSLGNFYRLKEILNRGYSPRAIRYELLSTHYRQQLNFTFDSLEASENAIKRLNDFIVALQNVKKPGNNSKPEEVVKKARAEFETALDDDLNVAPALGAVFTMVKELNKIIADGEMTINSAEIALDFLEAVDGVFNVMSFETAESDDEIDALVQERIDARASRDFARADEIRDKLTALGIQVEDTPEGPRWKRIK